MRILVVDDERDVVELVKKILEKEGYSVVPAYSGKEALDILKRESVDLVLLDVMMPEMSGWDVLESLRVHEEHRELPVTMVTVKRGLGDIERGYRLGVNSYIVKPFKRDVLTKSVRCILEAEKEERKGTKELLETATPL